jgi:hypothetical protein
MLATAFENDQTGRKAVEAASVLQNVQIQDVTPLTDIEDA